MSGFYSHMAFFQINNFQIRFFFQNQFWKIWKNGKLSRIFFKKFGIYQVKNFEIKFDRQINAKCKQNFTNIFGQKLKISRFEKIVKIGIQKSW